MCMCVYKGLCVPMCVCVQAKYIYKHSLLCVCMYGLGMCSVCYCGRQCYVGMVCIPQRKSLSTQCTHKPGAPRTSARLCDIVYRICVIYYISYIIYYICMCYKYMHTHCVSVCCMSVYCVSLQGVCARQQRFVEALSTGMQQACTLDK